MPKPQWRIANLRFTAFASEMPFPATRGELFQDFFGFTHDEETDRKREFMSEFSSVKGGVLYQTTISGPKIDFTVSPALSPIEVPDGMPSLPQEGNFEAIFSDAAKRLIKKMPRFARLAAGAHFILPSAGKEEGYRAMQIFLPTIKIDPVGSSDFQYRINRRRNLSLQEKSVSINRLVTWGCLGFKLQMMGNTSTHVGDAVSAMTDVNTDPSFDISSFTSEVQLTIIETLFNYSRELAEKGDVA